MNGFPHPTRRRRFVPDGRELPVWVERRWVEQPAALGGTQRRRVFQVRLADGRRCHLAQEPDGGWTLTQPEPGR